MELNNNKRAIKHAVKQYGEQVTRLGLTAMLTDTNSDKRSIAITVLMSHCRELARDFTDD